MSNQLISLISIIVALAAVCIAAWQVQVSVRSSQRQNALPIMSETWQHWRSPIFHAALQRLLTSTAEERSCQNFDELPSQLRSDAYDVCYFFDYLGSLVVFEIIDEDFVVGVMANRVMQIWIKMEPLILREREWRLKTYPPNTPAGFLVYYEHLVKRIIDLGGKDAANRIRRRRGVLHLDPGNKPLTGNVPEP